LQQSAPRATLPAVPCAVGCLALFFPRLAIIIVVLASDYIGQAYQTTIWPLLGFFFMPLTTLAYAFAMHQNSGSVSGIYLVLVVFAVLCDLGTFAGGASNKKVREVVVVRKTGP
jgi:hypothetical protein